MVKSPPIPRSKTQDPRRSQRSRGLYRRADSRGPPSPPSSSTRGRVVALHWRTGGVIDATVLLGEVAAARALRLGARDGRSSLATKLPCSGRIFRTPCDPRFKINQTVLLGEVAASLLINDSPFLEIDLIGNFNTLCRPTASSRPFRTP